MEEEVAARVACGPRDFLRRFVGGGREELAEAKMGELSEVELSLGLSLGGCSGMEPDERCFLRSSSIDTLSAFPPRAGAPLARTCSLPADSEEEQRKRKQLQSLKRVEAKRKRSEKRRWKAGTTDGNDDMLEEEMENPAVGGATDGVVRPLPRTLARKARGQMVDVTPETRVSVGSQGSGFYGGVSDFDCPPKHGYGVTGKNHHRDVRSLSAMNPTTSLIRKRVTFGEEEDERPRKAAWHATSKGVKKREGGRDMMLDMPSVSTGGDGPNGRRIDGFLYKYRDGEDVRIVCICHGRFFTPAEFVKHGGGGDVAHPLRHIVVKPSPAALLQ
ncbi:hypothetical protein OPV22_007639 [Ensete ventricosum]|uniref:Ninja-family protein n=1 Tax=Ensete ventricosum TaxID=4639 RepID=A0AAV8RS31_ENSVE|nr:hypothetical protein OPV22_007639 [Ensete ventricosum]